MKSIALRIVLASAFAGYSLSLGAGDAVAQLGKQQGLVEPNVAADSTLLRLPHVNADIVQALKDAKPILSVAALDSILGAKGLSKAQRTELYGKAFVHVDANRGTDAELLLIPGVDAAKLRAMKASRPWKSFEQFQTEIGKATSPAEATRLEQYLFIPIELNTFTEAIMDSFASIGVGTRQWKREFAEYRPWTSMEQFNREIGKYVRSRPTELKRLERYVIINK
jgi:DNA uptake protein ComE-like DNA-binding protein